MAVSKPNINSTESDMNIVKTQKSLNFFGEKQIFDSFCFFLIQGNFKLFKSMFAVPLLFFNFFGVKNEN